MRYTDIRPIEGTQTHPYIAEIAMDPAKWFKFEQAFEERPEVNILRVDRHTPDAWVLYAACVSKEVRDLLESNW
jgi:hypothetical protein